jgi:hypothetical protein
LLYVVLVDLNGAVAIVFKLIIIYCIFIYVASVFFIFEKPDATKKQNSFCLRFQMNIKIICMGFTFNLSPSIRKIRRIVFLCFLLFSGLKSYCAGPETTIVVQGADTTFTLTHNDIKTGERLFYGLIRNQAGQTSCVSCHNIKPVEEMNWNPSAFEVAALMESRNLDDLKTILLAPGGKKLSEAHAGYTTLTLYEVAQLKGFLQEYYDHGGYKQKPVINQILLFTGLVVIFLLALLDLVWFGIIRYRPVHVVVLLASALFITKIVVQESIAIGRSQDYMPDQPIKFSHMVHAGQNKIDCQFCHNSAEFGTSAGIPSMSVCLNCHMVVREGTRSGRFEINKIFAAIETKEPVQWTRVYKLPDHVFFSHAQHVGAGKLECQTCHGPVEQMDRITQVPDLSMGWCINCHRDTKVQFHDNQFYTKYDDLRSKLEKGQIDSVTVEMIGGTDCMKCHY